MKCISVRQPFADYILPKDDTAIYYSKTGRFFGPLPKNIENRTRPSRYTGPLLIHAGQNHYKGIGKKDPTRHVYGVIIGKVDMIGCCRKSLSPWHAPDQWGYCFVNHSKF